MEIFDAFYDFFGFELLTEVSTFTDLFNAILQVMTGLFIVFFFLRSLILLMLEIGNGRSIIE